MSLNQAILSLLQLFSCFSFFGASIFFLSLPFLQKLRMQICSVLIGNPSALYRIGGGFLVASLLLTLGFYALHRGRSLRIGMEISVDVPVIMKTLVPFFKEHFDGAFEVTDIHFSPRGKLEIELLSSLRDPKLLGLLEGKIASLLKERFGYSKPFFLNLKQN